MSGQPGVVGTVSQPKRETRLLVILYPDRCRFEFTGNAQGVQRPDYHNQAAYGRRSARNLCEVLVHRHTPRAANLQSTMPRIAISTLASLLSSEELSKGYT